MCKWTWKRFLSFLLACSMLCSLTVSAAQTTDSSSNDVIEITQDDLEPVDDSVTENSESEIETSSDMDDVTDSDAENSSENGIFDEIENQKEDVSSDDSVDTSETDQEMESDDGSEITSESDVEESVQNTETDTSVSDGTVLSEENTETEEEILSFSYDSDTLQVTVSGEASVLETVDHLAVTALEDRKSAYAQALQNTEVYENAQVLSVYDVTLYDADENEVEPKGDVLVSFSGKDIVDMVSSGGELILFHNKVETSVLAANLLTLQDSVSSDVIDPSSLEVVDYDLSENQDSFSFTVSSFSEYAFVFLAEIRSVSVEDGIQLTKDGYFWMDKYLEDTGASVNNQSTYNVYLEQAYYTSEMDVMQSAPSKQYIYMVLDQSSTMSNHNNVENMNSAVASFITSVYQENEQRMADARAGKYKDVNPNGNIEQQMQSHLIYFAGVLGFNDTTYTRYRNESGFAPLTQGQAQTVIDAAHVEDDYSEYQGLFSPVTTDIRVGTKTWLGLDVVSDWVLADGNSEYANVILCTDGRPSQSNEADENSIAIANSGGIIVSATNMTLEHAREMKDAGAILWGIYLEYDSEYSDTLLSAYSTGDISKLVIPDDACGIFMALYSSDYPQNGLFQKQNGVFTNYTYTPTDDDYFGKHTYLSLNANQFAADFMSLGNSILSQDKVAEIGYAGSDSYINDEVSDPFEITDSNSITVYKVPRIPANLGADNIPTDIDSSGYVTDFRWGDLSYDTPDGSTDTEWVDITDEVSVKVSGNVIQVTGFDYEKNAVTDYDKDYVSPWSVPDRNVYHEGDYGYKLVVVFGINAKLTFGGNQIETNNSDTSAFYPSKPQNTGLPEWSDNTTYNPGRNNYIDKYPVPHVDLNVSYDIPYDELIVYAPQTQNVHDLVTDASNSIWYRSEGYSDAKTVYDNALNSYNTAKSAFEDGEFQFNNGELSQSEYQALEDAYYAAYDVYTSARDTLASFENYTPDGINNAFVDIRYELKDPDGAVIGTMTVPHGTAYDADHPNVDWSLTQENVTKSGVYTITAVVTPVNTNRANGGHVYTELDSDDVKDAIGREWLSTKYSSTGSSASGSQSALTVTEHPSAYIYQLHVYTADSRLVKGQTIDFYEGNEQLADTDNVHITGYKWICTDGVTESVAANEPGVTGSMQVGSGVTITSQLPDRAWDEQKIIDIMGTTAVNAEDGEYVPVSALLSRNTGILNKSVDVTDATKQTLSYLSDSDNKYGSGVSSAVWHHDCGVLSDEEDCEHNDYADAQSYNTSDKGPVRYLIHVMDNPMPEVHKTTSTPSITKGENILWQVSLQNDDEDRNEHHRSSQFSMIDILPYNSDGRIDPNTNIEGSKFGGSLYYQSILIDLSDAPSVLARLKDGVDAVYYTTQTAVRTADEEKILGTSGSGNIQWQKASVSVSGTNAMVSGIPDNAVAIKFDTVLPWQEEVVFDMTANVVRASDQQVNDQYHNQAMVLNGSGAAYSEVAVTVVTSLYLSGTIWEDTDADGIMSGSEKRLEGITVTLYVPYNSNNGGSPDRTIGGVQLSRAFNTNLDKFAPYLTPEDGTFVFDDIAAGTYYIVADYIPEIYNPTIKQAGKNNSGLSGMDSECEESFTDTTSDLANTAWIKTVTVSKQGVPNQNFGMRNILGDVTIHKSLDEIYYPVTMPDEEKEDYRVVFTFSLRNTANGRTYTQNIGMKETDLGKDLTCMFEDIPLGTYELTEVSNAQYDVTHITSEQDSVSVSGNKAIIQVTPTEYHFVMHIENGMDQDPPGGDENGVKNHVNMHLPVSLDVIYSGPETITSSTLTTYQFKASDFSDMIVTYDDGSTASIRSGQLNFSQFSFSPATVTNDMNSGNDYVSIQVFYSEKGKTVSDGFKVKVNLKPIHKFQLNFDANGSTFNTGSTRNTVHFGYNEQTHSNYVTSGVYKDIANRGLNGRGSSYTFAGWNEQSNGSGRNYDGFTALNAVGQDSGISVLTLYANWKTNVTFNANGGVLAGGATDAEKVLQGRTSGTIPYSVNQSASTGLTATKTNYLFVEWNTRSDGRGTTLEDYGRITGPVTFYAIYYQSDYTYTGSVQTFTAPVDGWYRVQLWGAKGGNDDTDHIWGDGNDGIGGNGAYVTGEIHLTAGARLYVYVGQPGADNTTGTGAGWNGGGNPGSSGWSGSGGGATDIRTVSGNWDQNLNYRIAVAAGGGGAGVRSHNGGYGGALIGGNGDGFRERDGRGMGGTQTEAGKKGGFGYGGTASPDGGGGGGGWYGGGAGDNDTGAGGGSSYISGYPGCSNSITGYVFRNTQMIAGNSSMPKPGGGTEVGHSGQCYAFINLISRD